MVDEEPGEAEADVLAYFKDKAEKSAVRTVNDAIEKAVKQIVTIMFFTSMIVFGVFVLAKTFTLASVLIWQWDIPIGLTLITLGLAYIIKRLRSLK